MAGNRPGGCKICRFPQVAFLNHLIESGKNAAECNRWATDEFGFSFNRQSWYKHRDHYKNPSLPAKTNAVVPVVPAGPLKSSDIKRSSNREFLEAVRDVGFTRAQLDPESVTMDHSLKAASILEQSKQKSVDLTLVFAQVVTGKQPDVVIEGTAREVSAE